MSAHADYANQIKAARRAILAGQVPISEPRDQQTIEIEKLIVERATRRVELAKLPAVTMPRPQKELSMQTVEPMRQLGTFRPHDRALSLTNHRAERRRRRQQVRSRLNWPVIRGRR